MKLSHIEAIREILEWRKLEKRVLGGQSRQGQWFVGDQMKTMNELYLDKITLADCRKHLPLLADESIDLLLSDIPYGINLDDWDVLHKQHKLGIAWPIPGSAWKSGFRRRGKPINGWSQADRGNGKEYEEWCKSWVQMVIPKLKKGSSVFIFGARRTIHRVVNAFEENDFLLKDILAWKKTSAHIGHKG